MMPKTEKLITILILPNISKSKDKSDTETWSVDRV